MNARAFELVAALRSITRTLLGSGGVGFYMPIEHEQGLVQIHAVNDRAEELMAALRELARALPGATGIGFYRFVTCDFVQLTAATDPDVYVLGRALGLDGYEIRLGEGEGRGRWWLHAASRDAQGNWIGLAGPHHEGSPPGHEHAANPTSAVTSLLRRPRRAGRPRVSRHGAWVQAAASTHPADGTSLGGGLRSPPGDGTMPACHVDDEAQRADGQPPRGVGDRR